MSDLQQKISRLEVATLSGAAVLALASRFYRLDYGLPQVVWVDAFKFVIQAAMMVAAGNLKPIDCHYPGLFVNSLAILYQALDLRSAYGRYLAAYAVAAMFGAALPVLSWFAARPLTGPAGRVIAAILCLLCPVCLTFSRLPTTDCMAACFMMGVLTILARLPRRPAAYAGAGALAGLAIGAKWTGLFLLPFLMLTVFVAAARYQSRRTLYGGLSAAFAAAIVAFLITTPYFPLLWRDYLHGFYLESVVQSRGTIGEVQLGWFDYLLSRTPAWETPWLGSSLAANLGPGCLILGLVAAVCGLSARFGFPLLLYSLYALLYLACASRPGHAKTIRYLIPILPALFVLIGWLLERAADKVVPRLRTAALLAAFMLVAAVPAAKSARYLFRLSRPSTNDEARAWARRSIPPGTSVYLSPFYTLDFLALPLRLGTIPDAGQRIHDLPAGLGRSPERDFVYYPGLLDELRAAGVRYLIFNSYFDAAFSAVPENLRWFPKAVAQRAAFMARVLKETEPVYAVRGEVEGRFGPDITVYRIKEPR
ncbi:MAG: glycosyltransferase family 39 protein [Elusimicrobia bacterium]|nr:glycosyltransferase family 39 protein [Elusimicrobiota bacterium]